MHEPECLAPTGGQGPPERERLREKRVRAHHVGLYERIRPIDRPVYMRLGRQVNYAIGLIPGEQRAQSVRIADVYLFEVVASITRHGRDGLEVGGIREFVNVDHVVAGGGDEPTHEGRPDKPRSTCDENRAHGPFSLVDPS